MPEPITGTCAPWLTPDEFDALNCCDIEFTACLGPAAAIADPADIAQLTLAITSLGPGLWRFVWNDLSFGGNNTFLTDLGACIGGNPEDVLTVAVDFGGIVYEMALPVWAVTATTPTPTALTVDLDFSLANPGSCDLATELLDWQAAAALYVANTGGAPVVTVSQSAACNGQSGAAGGLSLAEATGYIQIASNILYKMSGYKYPGACTTAVRPCDARCSTSSTGGRYLDSLSQGGWGMPYRNPDGWYNCFCSCDECYQSNCGCNSLSSIKMPEAPVVSVQEVWLDGVELVAAGAIRVDEFNQIVRTDGDPWPCCQNLLGDPTVVGENGWEISYTYGRTPPPEGILAAAVLACEIAKSCNPALAGECRLPSGVQTITRQGVTMSFQSQSLLATRAFSIPEIDMFLLGESESKARHRGAFIVGPDTVKPPRRVNT